jgi:hypothetical protein
LRRTTSALTTAVLGAALTASMVSAQQSSTPDNAPQASPSPAAAAAAPKSATEVANSQLYGMSATRGARQLLRNGLDYLSYQQYERSLGFLREAEARQKELNDAERTALKQGIESAQRGLRNATDAESPYALSDRSRPRSGFTPAEPATRVAATANQSKQSTRRARKPVAARTEVLESDGDDQGQPIRLASSETPISDPPTELAPSARSVNTQNAGAPRGPLAGQPRNIPEIPVIPPISQLPDLTEANSLERQVTANGRFAPGAKPATATMPAVSGRVVSPAVDTQLPEQAPALAGQLTKPAEIDAADLQPQADLQLVPPTTANGSSSANKSAAAPDPRSSDPAPVAAPVVEAPAAQVSQTGTLPSPVSSGDHPAPANAVGGAEIMPAPTTAEPADEKPAPQATKSAPPIDVKTIPSSATAEETLQEVDRSTSLHKESEDAAAALAPSPLPTTPVADDNLPALPDLGRPAATAPAGNESRAQSITTVDAGPVVTGDDDLPPLPANLGRSVPTTAMSIVSPGQTPPAATPAVIANELPSQAGEVQPVPTPVDVESPKGDVGSDSTPASASSATTGSAGVVASQPTSTELPALAGSDAPSGPAEPASQPYPATNPNLQPPSAGSTPAAALSRPDDGSLPPAIADRPVASTSGLLLPDRPTPPTTLRPDLMREVEMIARNQEDEMRRKAQNPQQQPALPRDTMASDLRTQTQLDISRAPSPAEARPIKAIPVPEDWVPLRPRNWTPQRKYWAAAATCHLPLYFQDPVLERYGHSVEQFVGPIGRFLTYPVDDPTQSTQRNQMLQPFFSAGLMGLQIVAWPYNLIMDPPWEAQYDLGYYRPGDSIPTDTYWLPLHGYGPPLRGSNY